MTKYYFVIAANEDDWCYFDAAVTPGHEEELKAAILADMPESTYHIDTFEAYAIDDDGTLTCADTRATYYCDDPESIAKALPLDGKPFAFLVGDSGLHG